MTHFPSESKATSASLQAKLARLKNRRTGPSEHGPKATGATEAPLTATQSNMWMANQLDSNSCSYQCSGHLLLHGPLDESALLGALADLQAHHSALRMTVVNSVDGLTQRIQTQKNSPCATISLQHLVGNQQSDELARIANEFTFDWDIEEGCALFRTQLVRLADASHVLLISYHHLIGDGQSANVIERDLLTLYEARINNSPAPLPAPTISFLDYVLKERAQHQDGTYNEQLNYWRKTLSSLPSPVTFPLDKDLDLAGLRERSDTGRVCRNISKSVTSESIKRFCGEQNVSPYTLFVAASSILLYHYGNREGQLIGCPTAGRDHAELKNTVGCFIRTIPLLLAPDSNLSVKDFLTAIRATLTEGLSNSRPALSDLSGALGAPSINGNAILFDVIVQHRNFNRVKTSTGNLSSEPYKSTHTNAPNALSLEWETGGDNVACTLIYNENLFSSQMIEQMATHAFQVLTRVIAEPEAPLWTLSPLNDEAIQQQQVVWNGDVRRFEFNNVVTMLDRWVANTPDRPAVEHEQSQLTFAELHQRSQALAFELLELDGATSGGRIGLLIERSPAAIVALLGVLRAGKSYFFINPDAPQAHLDNVLATATPQAVVSTQEIVLDLPVVAIERSGILPNLSSSTHTNSSLLPEIQTASEAYVVFTSGTTGAPKGVRISHGGLANYIQAFSERMPMQQDDRLLQISALEFDFAVEEIFAPLTSGATLVLRTDTMIDPQVCGDAVENLQITQLSVPASFFREFIRRFESRPLPSQLRALTTGGEEPKPEYLRLWHAANRHNAKLFNGYGPSEITIASTIAELLPNQFRVPIGRGLANYSHFVLGPNNELLPPGTPGELYIGGPGVCMGYLGASAHEEQRLLEATQLHGVPDDVGRLFRTGDTVSFDIDGVLYFSGRKDRQIKHKGYRVEPAMIEAELLKHPALLEAVVSYSKIRNDLVAWFQTNHQQQCSSRELLTHLLQKLPNFMVPGTYIEVTEWPLGQGGKISQSQLLEQLPDRAQSRETPETETERLVAQTWAEMLNLPVQDIGQDDIFIQLGGTSIQATQCLVALNEHMPHNMKISLLLEPLTLQEFSVFLETESALLQSS